MSDFEETQSRIKAIADVVNAFKSEAVQLRVVEVLLAQLGVASQAASPGDGTAPKRTKRRRTGTKTESPAEVVKDTQRKSKPRAARSSSSPGAFAMTSQLLAEDFFKTPRTIGSIVTHCGTTKGHHYKASECSPALLRLLRDGKLKRQKNKDGQYEYNQA
jgi:hypothetical protein